ncbi:MAG: hypothetical protein IMZ52_02310 [Actinobacteria bacterium]|nr:hypothetical protein [Actinomycetota bacterium]MBE3114856.1 hypothetical protein [Actinomycetota bacterium]
MDIKHIRVGGYYIVTNKVEAIENTYFTFPSGIKDKKQWIAKCLDITNDSVLLFEFVGNGKMIKGHSNGKRCWYKNSETVLRKADVYGKDKKLADRIWLYEI